MMISSQMKKLLVDFTNAVFNCLFLRFKQFIKYWLLSHVQYYHFDFAIQLTGHIKQLVLFAQITQKHNFFLPVFTSILTVNIA